MTEGAARCYRTCGLLIESPVPLPDVPEEAPVGDPDVVVRIGRAPSSAGPARLALPHGATLAIVEGRFVFIEDATEPASLVPWLLGPAIAVLLRQRGHAVLHAAAVEIDGRTIALAGRSGAGKSTIAASLCAAGGRMLVDDVCAVNVVGTSISIAPGPPQLALRPETLDVLSARVPLQGEPRADGRVLAPVSWIDRARALTAIYVLQRCAGTPTEIVTPIGARLAGALLAASYRPWLGVDGQGQMQDLERLIAVARRCPLFQVRGALDGSPESVAGLLRGHVTKIGPLPSRRGSLPPP